mgnify:CR=1 FL=1
MVVPPQEVEFAQYYTYYEIVLALLPYYFFIRAESAFMLASGSATTMYR